MLDSLTAPFIQSWNAHTPLFFICAVLGVLLVGISKSGFGAFGAGLGTLSIPILTTQVSVAEALAILHHYYLQLIWWVCDVFCVTQIGKY